MSIARLVFGFDAANGRRRRRRSPVCLADARLGCADECRRVFL